jgi:hypothetical protein
MKVFALLLVFLILQRGFRFDGEIRESLEITQPKAQCAIDIIL